jgi:hypothetical protein
MDGSCGTKRASRRSCGKHAGDQYRSLPLGAGSSVVIRIGQILAGGRTHDRRADAAYIRLVAEIGAGEAARQIRVDDKHLRAAVVLDLDKHLRAAVVLDLDKNDRLLGSESWAHRRC